MAWGRYPSPCDVREHCGMLSEEPGSFLPVPEQTQKHKESHHWGHRWVMPERPLSLSKCLHSFACRAATQVFKWPLKNLGKSHAAEYTAALSGSHSLISAAQLKPPAADAHPAGLQADSRSITEHLGRGKLLQDLAVAATIQRF